MEKPNMDIGSIYTLAFIWWPGIILHPSEIPPNILAVKHSPGEFVVRFFGQYDHYWVNRGRVFPFQEAVACDYVCVDIEISLNTHPSI
ncbi:putative histone-lysine N-methyltransferase NSD2 [Papilio xuthus]|uniref:Putative histone-lysine N-methyltransferase NSD2 n=1 Tax=Papilio xuthus TaxID=66420 RepID=A0A0N1IN64_PAPXU|nr:putative histone-lysine N-methyltransferase NSD2 [Papilio xuthus]